jgi:hypothetical protein
MSLKYIGHSGIPGNERADQVARRARSQAELQQPGLYLRPDISAPFLNFNGLSPYFTELWNRHWINEGNEMEPHKIPKRYLPNLIECQSFEKTVLHNLDMHERQIVCRIITGKIGLNSFLFKIKCSSSQDCGWCDYEEETVEHFLMECPHYENFRQLWKQAVKALVPQVEFATENIRSLVVGEKWWKPATRIQVVKELSKFIAATGRRI